jgi:hypothetical protein
MAQVSRFVLAVVRPAEAARLDVLRIDPGGIDERLPRGPVAPALQALVPAPDDPRLAVALVRHPRDAATERMRAAFRIAQGPIRLSASAAGGSAAIRPLASITGHIRRDVARFAHLGLLGLLSFRLSARLTPRRAK